MNSAPLQTTGTRPGVPANPILDNWGHQRRKYDFPEASAVLRKCSCRNSWCPTCHKKYFMPGQERKMAKFDWRRTRHVCLTMPRTAFDDPAEAYSYVTEKKKLAALIKGLKRGVRVKVGGQWVWKFPPVNVSKWYWALEWHKDGFPHWHLLIEVAGDGQTGMIGGDVIRHFWKLGWIKETYFRSEAHFKNLVGYYGKHGYFERDKAYQGVLPAKIKAALRGRRIERTGGSMGTSTRRKNDERVEGTSREIQEKEKRFVDYTVILESCGLYSQVSLKMKETEVTVITDIPYRTIKERVGGEYVEGEGVVATIGPDDVGWILENAVKVPYFRSEDREAYERWSRGFRLKIEREMIKGCYNRSCNPVVREAL